jgi:hypothetical protein
MSTVAVTDTEIAADSLTVADDQRFPVVIPKILVGSHRIWAYVGDISAALHILTTHLRTGEKFSSIAGALPGDPDWQIIEIGEQINPTLGIEYNHDQLWGTAFRTPYAMGSGAKYAYGSLFVDDSAATACEAAAEYDIYTGRPIETYALQDLLRLRKNVQNPDNLFTPSGLPIIA